MYDQT